MRSMKQQSRLPHRTECIHYETKADFLAAAPQILKEQDAILLKASNAQKFKELVSALQEM